MKKAKPVKPTPKPAPDQEPTLTPKQLFLRIETLIVVAILVMIWVISWLVIPVLQKSGRNTMRQQDINFIEERLQFHYDQHGRPATHSEVINLDGHFKLPTDQVMKIYDRAIFKQSVTTSGVGQSIYSTDTQAPSLTDKLRLPDEYNLHIWFGYQCQATTIGAWQPTPDSQPTYGAWLDLIEPTKAPASYAIIYKLEQRQTAYRCRNLEL